MVNAYTAICKLALSPGQTGCKSMQVNASQTCTDLHQLASRLARALTVNFVLFLSRLARQANANQDRSGETFKRNIIGWDRER